FWRSLIEGQAFEPEWLDDLVIAEYHVSKPSLQEPFLKKPATATRKRRARPGMATGNPVLDAYLRQVKPFNFLGVLHKARPLPTDAFQAPYAPNKELGAVVAPLSTKPIEQWEWVVQRGGHVHPITSATSAGLTRDEAAAWGQMVVARTYREL